MAGGYDGSLRFDARIDKDDFLRSVADLEKALTMLEQSLKGMQSAITGNFDAIEAEAEQAASDIGNIAAEAEAIPPSEDVAVTVSEQGIHIQGVAAVDAVIRFR